MEVNIMMMTWVRQPEVLIDISKVVLHNYSITGMYYAGVSGVDSGTDRISELFILANLCSVS
jgi:hypothetical protein